ncbi:hypothetical protein NliqN6_1160 [Naganishia liquefaciens]|uniref:AAA+ ATPase domain-containing protein n=1 Tax=Naganishia liquefaciens TaxID=104408 RepID=A0A8H3YD17_9TREE|nr:hypothetical protein NliqN6_1160 [Naganishia liquefaciens]
MTPPSPSSTRPYTRATASAVAAGKRRAVDSDDENDADGYFDASHENPSPNASRPETSRSVEEDDNGAARSYDREEREDVDMVHVRLTMDDADEGILEQPSTSTTTDDQDGANQSIQSVSAMDSSCGRDCSGGNAYDLRSRHYGRGKENIPPIADEDWHRAANERSGNGYDRQLSTPDAGPSVSRHAAEDSAAELNSGSNSAIPIDASPIRRSLRRSRTLTHVPSTMEPPSPRMDPPVISISAADPPALSTRARSSRRFTRGNPATHDESDAAGEETDREDDMDEARASTSSDGSRNPSLASGVSNIAESFSSRKRRCIRSSASLQVPITSSSAANQVRSGGPSSPSPSSSSSSFQVPTLRSSASMAGISSTSSSRRVTRTASSPNITRSATFSGSSTSTSQPMYSMSCAANKRRLSNGPNSQAVSLSAGLAELANASGGKGTGGGRPAKNRKREMSVSSVRSEVSISAMSATSYASYSVTSSIPSSSQGIPDQENGQSGTKSSSSKHSQKPGSSKSNKIYVDDVTPPTNRRLFDQPTRASASGRPSMASNGNSSATTAVAKPERFTLARTNTTASSASNMTLQSSSPTSEASLGFLFPTTPTDETVSSPMRSMSRLHSDDIRLLGDLALTPKRTDRRGNLAVDENQTPGLCRSPSASSRDDMDVLLDTPSSRVSAIFATPRAGNDQTMYAAEAENQEDQFATPLARRQYSDGYKALKAALKCSSSGNDGSKSSSTAEFTAIVGREDEKISIRQYLVSGTAPTEDNEDAGHKGLYISGPPGTGKTATVTALIAENGSECRLAFVNCMGLVGKKEEIWWRIADAWGFMGDKHGKEKPERLIERGLKKSASGSRFILVLDEVDALIPPKSYSASNQILRALFALPYHHAELDLKLIAIANSLDLTVRKSVASILGTHAPSNLTFKAYGAKEMTDIIKRRLHDCNEALKANCPNVLPAHVDEKAIELVGRKVEANNGDLRMCLGVLVDAINATEAEWRKKATAAGAVGDIAPFKVSLTHVLKALSAYNRLKANAAATSSTSSATSGSSNLDNKVRSLNVQVRMILLAWLISRQRLQHGLRPAHVQAASAQFGGNSTTSSTDSISTEALYPTYTYVLSSAASPFPPASQPDFMDLLMQAEVLGLLSVEGGDGLTPSKSKARRGRAKERAVELLVKEEDLKAALGIKRETDAESTIAMDSEIRAIWNREEKRWLNAVAGRQRAADSARRHAENGTVGFNEAQ